MADARVRHVFRSLTVILGLLASAPHALADAPSGTLLPVRKDGAWGFIDRAGRVAIPPRFDAVGPFSEGLAAVRIEERHAYVDASGRIALEPAFAPAGAIHRRFSSARAVVKLPGGYGYVDRTGALAIRDVFARAEDFSDGVALVCTATDCGYIDPAGKAVISVGPMGGTQVHAGMGAAIMAMSMGRERLELVDLQARKRIGVFEGLGALSEGLIAIRLNGAWGYMDRRGLGVIPPQFQAAGDFSENLAAVTDASGKCGYIDVSGKKVIAPRFGRCHAFASGRARVDLSTSDLEAERVAFIDRTGKIVISGSDAKPPFDSAEDFVDGLAAVGRGGEPRLAGTGPLIGYIDTQGRYVWTPSE